MYAPEHHQMPPPAAGWGMQGQQQQLSPSAAAAAAAAAGAITSSSSSSMMTNNVMAAAYAVPTSNCPRGLEYLTQVDQLLVQQKVELLEAFTGFETANKYTIKNTLGQKVFYAAEDTDCCTRNVCGPIRPFDMQILDLNKQQVLLLNRPLRCDSCLCFCCLQKLDVYASPGDLLGTVEQTWSLCKPEYVVRDAAGNSVLRILGPFCTFSMCGDVEFQVVSDSTGQKVGKISKQWSGLVKEAFTDADNFGVSFPLDLDVRVKAVLLGAVFLIDFMFFEKKANRESDGIGMFS